MEFTASGISIVSSIPLVSPQLFVLSGIANIATPPFPPIMRLRWVPRLILLRILRILLMVCGGDPVYDPGWFGRQRVMLVPVN